MAFCLPFSRTTPNGTFSFQDWLEHYPRGDAEMILKNKYIAYHFQDFYQFFCWYYLVLDYWDVPTLSPVTEFDVIEIS